MRSFLTILFLFFVTTLIAQNPSDSVIVFSGYILSEDSVPMENAYLINYRDTKIVMTDSTGYFKIFAQKVIRS